MNHQQFELAHQEMLYPCVRVRTQKAGGSGTILYSKPGERPDEYETYVLTNEHVIDDAIKVDKKWSSLLQREIKVDSKSTVDVELFRYRWQSRAIGGTAVQADIVAYDKDEDLALLKLRDPSPAQHVAKLYPRGEESALSIFTPVYAIGAALGHPPVVTRGVISGFGDEIDNREYWLSTAPVIFGNSGGAVFLESSRLLIGVPSRVAVTLLGFSATPISHLGWLIPITRLYKWFEDQLLYFLYDSNYTPTQCEKLRKERRDSEERRQAGKERQGEEPDAG